MKIEFAILYFSTALLVTNIDNVSVNHEQLYLNIPELPISQNYYDAENQYTRIGFYRKNDNDEKKHPLLNQKLDLSSGVNLKKKDIANLNNDNTTESFLGSLYCGISGHLIFGRRMV